MEFWLCSIQVAGASGRDKGQAIVCGQGIGSTVVKGEANGAGRPDNFGHDIVTRYEYEFDTTRKNN